ncbi:MAG TPA: heat-inducible transcriptional repressor HrcA [Gemmatimonadales bacterium]
MAGEELTDRERKVLDAVVQAYIDTAEPAGSRTIAKTFPLGVSAATIRNTMSDLEDRGYLYHPHTSAGRVPTDLAYRAYVDRVIWQEHITPSEQDTLRRELTRDRTAIEGIVRKAAQVLGVLTQELGVAVAPSLVGAVLEHLELVQVSAERLLMVLVLRGGAARTIFVEASAHLPPDVVQSVASVLNERLVGLTLQEIRRTLPERVRDTGGGTSEKELLNIFVEEADQLFDVDGKTGQDVVLGSAQLLAEQPEFHSNEQMRALIELTERRDLLRRALQARNAPGLNVTIGGENLDARLAAFTIVTSAYRAGSLSGTIGVIGPTRMPYEKVLSLVQYTSRLMGDLVQ